MNKIITKKNNIFRNTKKKHKYKCIFHYPLTQNDCINSIDIIDDKILIGTIMGDVNLLRIDKNNLLVRNKGKYKNIANGGISNNKISYLNNIKNGTKERECIHLKDKNQYINLDINNNEKGMKQKMGKLKNYMNYQKLNVSKGESESQTIDRTNDNKTKEQTRNKKIKLIKLNNKSCDSSTTFLKSKKLSVENKINIKKIKIKNNEDEENNDDMNIRYDNTNIEKNNSLEEKKDSEKENSIKNKNENKDLLNINIKKFPQITKLINRSNENIPCLAFDTDDKVNISIGDLELICMEKMSEFNIKDKNSSYNYFKIKNYKNDTQHLRYCEHCTCMMNSSHFLMIYTQFADFNSDLKILNVKYKNRNLKNYKIIKGKIQLSNYCVPFDFDGDRFLFLDYITKEERRICIYYTLSDLDEYECVIEKEFGHISHMKLISKEDNKIFLCRNNNNCEIHLLDENFTCIESWKHIGTDNISSFVYIKESKITEEFENRINIKKYIGNIDCNNYIDEDDNKGILKNIKIKRQKKNNKDTYIEQIQGGSTILNININSVISSSNNNKIKCLNNTENLEKSPKNKSANSSLNGCEILSKKDYNKLDNKSKKTNNDGIYIYNAKKYNGIDKWNNLNNMNFEYKDKIEELNSFNKKDISNTIENDSIGNNYYIITLDKNGNVNLYKNKIVTNIFNLYEVENIEEKYKGKLFFSIGFPYFIVMNELYIGITTDYGLFVISNTLDE